MRNPSSARPQAEPPRQQSAGHTIPDPSVRLSDVEAILAVIIDHQDQRIRHLTFACGVLLHAVYGRDVRDQRQTAAGVAYRALYSEEIVPGSGARQGALPPFPIHWLRSMAQRRCTFAQVAENRQDAVDRMTRALAR